MATFDLVKDGVIVETRDFGDVVPSDLSHKDVGLWLPRVLVGMEAPFDPLTQVRDETVAISAGQVTYTYTVREMNADELDFLRGPLLLGISNEYHRRASLPVEFTAGGVSKQWDADDGAIRNISGVVLLIAAGVPVPDPRPWTAYGEMEPTNITHAELVGLGATIAARVDTLFATKKIKEAELSAFTSAADVLAYDVLAGWE